MTARHEVRVHAPVERCFDLARSVDLHEDSSKAIGARAVGGKTGGLSGGGDVTTWSARFFGLRFKMTTRIEDFAPPRSFGDRLTHGLLRRFEHVYHFAPTSEGDCVMSDELTAEAPFGPFGKGLEKFYLARRMQCLVRLRLEHIKRVAESDEWRRYLEQ